jgi:hypothetical protein
VTVTAASLGRDSTPRPGVDQSDITAEGQDSNARNSPRRPGVLLDRDGTIIVDHGYVGAVDRVDFIDGASEAIARFNRARIPVAVVTNQSGVARRIGRLFGSRKLRAARCLVVPESGRRSPVHLGAH